MQLNELLDALPGDLLVEYTAEAAPAAHNPAARWIGTILLRELARRNGEVQAAIQPLELEGVELEFCAEWLVFSAAKFCDTGLDRGDEGMCLLGALLDHVHKQLMQRASATMQ